MRFRFMPMRAGRSHCWGGRRSIRTRRRSSDRRGTGLVNIRRGMRKLGRGRLTTLSRLALKLQARRVACRREGAEQADGRAVEGGGFAADGAVGDALFLFVVAADGSDDLGLGPASAAAYGGR